MSSSPTPSLRSISAFVGLIIPSTFIVPILLISLSVSESCGFTSSSIQCEQTAAVVFYMVNDNDWYVNLPFTKNHTVVTRMITYLHWLSLRSFYYQLAASVHSRSNTCMLPFAQGKGFLLTGWWIHLQDRLPLWSLVQTHCLCSLPDGEKWHI